MAFSTGDLVPYNQLPGAVAGQGAQQIMGQYKSGQIDQATLEDAFNKATQSDLATKVAMQDAPTAAILKNIKDAQSLNAPLPTATSDDIEAARAAVMGDSVDAPDRTQHEQIMAKAKEMAAARAPKLNPMDPTDYLMQQTNPLSNKDMDLLRYQELYKGRLGVADLNASSREHIAADKMDWEKEKLGVTEAGKNSRADVMAGAVSGNGAPTLKSQKVGMAILHEFNQSTAGLMLNSNAAALKNPQNEGFVVQAVSTYNHLVNTGNIPDAVLFYNTNAKKLQELGHPLNPPPKMPAPKKTTPKPPPDTAEVPPPSDNALAATDTGSANAPPIGAPIQPGPDQAMRDLACQTPATQQPTDKRKVIEINGQAYGVGDIITIRKIKYRVNPDGSATKVQ